MNCPICNKEMNLYNLVLYKCQGMTSHLWHTLSFNKAGLNILEFNSDLINCILTLTYNKFLLIKEKEHKFVMKFDNGKELYESFLKIQSPEELKTKIYQLYKEQIFSND